MHIESYIQYIDENSRIVLSLSKSSGSRSISSSSLAATISELSNGGRILGKASLSSKVKGVVGRERQEDADTRVLHESCDRAALGQARLPKPSSD